MGTASRAAGCSQLSADELITYDPAGGVTRLTSRYDTYRAVVGKVVSDDAGVVTYTDLLPPTISVVVATGGTATPGHPAIIGGTMTECDGYADSPGLSSGNAHFVSGIFATSGSEGDTVQLHPFPHFCPGGDV